jgi:hypothetical protein
MPTIINGTTGVNLITDGSVTTADFASGAINNTVLPAGSVLQMVNATYSTQVSNSTSTYADTGLTASITPSSASNKILVLVNQASIGKDTGNISSGCIVKLLRNSTDLCVFAGPAGYTQTNIYNLGWNASASYLDSPSTTSSVTYKTQFANGVNAASVRVQTDNNTSTIVLMEIKG